MDKIKAQASAKDPSTNVRLPVELIRYIDAQAKANGRSRNSEIIMRLRITMQQDEAA